MRMVMSLLVVLAASQAHAADWRYCLAQDEDTRKVYVTDPFQSDRTLQSLEAQFNEWLRANELYSNIAGICPRAISPYGPAADIRAAVEYNRGLGVKAVRVDWLP